MYSDDAVSFSVNYLNVLQNRLKVTFDHAGLPVFVPSRVTDSDMQSLRAELHDLLNGTPGNGSVEAVGTFSNEQVTSVGFGFQADFDSFIKVGLLSGERMVLWDLIGGRLLNHDQLALDQYITIGQAACNLLMIRPVIEDGAIVILPHPTAWCEFAQLVHQDLSIQGNKCMAKYGLSMALATHENGLLLHPFTLLLDTSPPKANAAVSDHQRTAYSFDSYIFQHAISELLKNQRFAYLQNVSPVDFYKTISGSPEIARSLHRLFGDLVEGHTSLQLSREIIAATEDLARQIESRNKAVTKYILDGTEATTVVALLLATTIHTSDFDDNTATGLAIGTISTRLWMALRKWMEPGSTPVVVKAFKSWKSVASSSFHEPESQVVHDDQVKRCKEMFTRSDWIEDRYSDLKAFPLEVVQQVLNSLTHDELHYNVNRRRHQDDYIGDFLVDLHSFNTPSFWQHIRVSFESNKGLLLYDGNFHLEIMCSEDMPLDVWQALLKSICSVDSETAADLYMAEVLASIIRFQTLEADNKSDRQTQLRLWFAEVPTSSRPHAEEILKIAFSDELPSWLC